jgi:RNA polymerase sigma-70 factor, ECF subfamily
VDSLFRAADADERQVLGLSLQSYTAEEISLRLGRALRTVQRLRKRIRKRLDRLHEDN